MIHRRYQLQWKIWKFLIQNSITYDQLEGQNTISEIANIAAIGRTSTVKYPKISSELIVECQLRFIVHNTIFKIVKIAV
jgi:hypothetical protein